MDKRQLVAAAARRSTLTRRQVDEALRVLLETVAETLAAGEPVVLRDLGRFSTWRRRQRIRGFDGHRQGSAQGKSPKGSTPQVHQVDEAQLVFKASAALRRRLKGEP